MDLRLNHSLKSRIILYQLVFCLVPVFILTGITFYLGYKNDLKTLENRFDQVRTSYLEGIAGSIWTLDRTLTETQIRGISELPDFAYVAVEAEGELFAENGTLPQHENIITHTYPLTYTQNDKYFDLGKLTVIADLSDIRQQTVKRLIGLFVLQFCIIVLLVLFLSLLVNRMILRHLDDMSRFMRSSSTQELDIPYQLDRSTGDESRQDELDVLVNAFNYQRQELRKSRKRYQSIVDDQTEFIVRWKPGGIRTFVNKSYCNYFSVTPEEALGTSFFPLIEQTDLDKIQARIGTITADNPVASGEHRMVLTDGSISWVYWVDRGLFNEHGDLIEYQSVGRDITVLKKATEALFLSEEKFYKAFQSSPVIFMITLVADGTIIEVNHTYVQLSGWSRGESIGKTTVELGMLQPEQRDAMINKIHENGYFRDVEISYNTKFGSEKIGLVSAQVIEISGEPCLISMVQDITLQKQAENALKESEARLQEAQEVADLGHWSWDPNTKKISCNSIVFRIFGFEPFSFEPTFRDFINVCHPDDQRLAAKILQEEVKTVRERVFRVIWPDKTVHHVLTTVRRDEDTSGNLIRLFGIAQDVTYRKQTEHALLDSERRLKEAQKIAKLGYWHWDLHSREILWSEELTQLLNLNPEKSVQKQFIRILHPDDREFVLDIFRGKTQLEKNSEFRAILDNGEQRTMYFTGRSELNSAGKPAFLHGIVQDITELKRYEQELRESEQKFSKAFLSSPYPISITQLGTGLLLEVNQAAEKLLGYDRSELIGHSPLDLSIWVNPEIREYMINQLSIGEPIRELQADARAKNGKIIHCEVSAELITLEDEPCLVVIIHDITKRKKAEIELLLSRERLRNLVNQLEDIREDERAGIARELHDELGQALTGLKLDLSTVFQNIESDTVRDQLSKMIANIDSTVDIVRKISSELRPPMLDDLGLVAAMEWVTNGFIERSNIQGDLAINCNEPEPEHARDTAIFRIYQEALVNIARHSQADNFQATLKITGDRLNLTIVDNGVGITDEQLNDVSSIGLIGMYERAAHIGGSVSVSNVPSGGVSVQLEVPL